MWYSSFEVHAVVFANKEHAVAVNGECFFLFFPYFFSVLAPRRCLQEQRGPSAEARNATLIPIEPPPPRAIYFLFRLRLRREESGPWPDGSRILVLDVVARARARLCVFVLARKYVSVCACVSLYVFACEEGKKNYLPLSAIFFY